MSDVKFSIIIPVYNVENFLQECVESILAQSYKDFELILVDDGSMDRSGVICDKYSQKDTRIQVIHQPNSGVSKARNAGLAVAEGEWITFIDSDDWVNPDFLENFKIEDAGDCDLVCQGMKYIDHNTRREKRRTAFDNQLITAPDQQQLIKKYDILGFGVTVCKCFKRSIIGQHGIAFDEKIAYHEDHIFTLEYISHTQLIITTCGCGYNYRCGHNRNSLSRKSHSWQSQESASRKMIESLNKICLVYHIDESYYSKMMSFYLGTRVNAADQVYKEKMTDREKRNVMLSIIRPLNEITDYYVATSRRYKPICILAKERSGFLLHIYFMICSKLWR